MESQTTKDIWLQPVKWPHIAIVPVETGQSTFFHASTRKQEADLKVSVRMGTAVPMGVGQTVQGRTIHQMMQMIQMIMELLATKETLLCGERGRGELDRLPRWKGATPKRIRVSLRGTESGASLAVQARRKAAPPSPPRRRHPRAGRPSARLTKLAATARGWMRGRQRELGRGRGQGRAWW